MSEQKYAVYVLLTIDDAETDMAMGEASAESVERIEGDLTNEQATYIFEAIMKDYT